jgi:uncharacterized protein (TIGR00730 family)
MSESQLQIKRVCVYCGSSFGARRAYVGAAERIGAGLARRGIHLVYGGGCVGLMGAVADAVLAAHGHVIGVIPEMLAVKEVAHRGLPDLRVVQSMHQRKALMMELADAFVALPGGFGTLEELSEILTWAQLGLHRKPCALLNIEGFFDPLLAFLDHATAEGLLRPEHRGILLVETDPERILDRLFTAPPPLVGKWIEKGGA